MNKRTRSPNGTRKSYKKVESYVGEETYLQYKALIAADITISQLFKKMINEEYAKLMKEQV